VVFVLVAACLAAPAYGLVNLFTHDSSIWVIGTGWNSENFSYDIRSSRILQTGKVNEFKIGSSQSEFFADLRKSYPVFAESEDRIQLIYNSEIYTVRRYPDDHYALYGELVWLRDEEGYRWHFPFPSDRIAILGGTAVDPQPLIGTKFTVNCDLPYLLRFYEVYGDQVKVEGNRITWGGTTLTVGDGGLIEVGGP
jgi:hypothetical protein